MKTVSIRTLAGMAALLLLTACVSTQTQPDGSTKVKISVAEALGIKPAESSANAATPNPTAPAAMTAPSIKTSKLAGLFTKHPYDGTTKSHFPRVAVTVIDWSRNDCWIAVATIWWSQGKSERVAPFSVCWSQSLGFAVNNAANLHLFMEQTAFEHSGNVRTNGPKPPMMAIPDRQPIRGDQQNAFSGFIQQLVLDTGWGAGAPTNIWLVGYDAKAGTAAPAAAPEKPGDTSATAQGSAPSGGNNVAAHPEPWKAAAPKIQAALECRQKLNPADPALRPLLEKGKFNWELTPPQGFTAFGLPVQSISIFIDTTGELGESYTALVAVPMDIASKAAHFKNGSRETKSKRLFVQPDPHGGSPLTSVSCIHVGTNGWDD